MSKHKVMKRRCDQCLYGPDKIVSNRRRAEILRECRAKDTDFLCHKGSNQDLNIVCRGHLDASGGGQLTRIAGRLGWIEFIDPETMTPVKDTA